MCIPVVLQHFHVHHPSVRLAVNCFLIRGIVYQPLASSSIPPSRSNSFLLSLVSLHAARYP